MLIRTIGNGFVATTVEIKSKNPIDLRLKTTMEFAAFLAFSLQEKTHKITVVNEGKGTLGKTVAVARKNAGLIVVKGFIDKAFVGGDEPIMTVIKDIALARPMVTKIVGGYQDYFDYCVQDGTDARWRGDYIQFNTPLPAGWQGTECVEKIKLVLKCDCTKSKMKKVVKALGIAEEVEIACEFCEKKYHICVGGGLATC